MLKRHEVEILLRAGHRKGEVAGLTGVSLCSVKRIAAEDPVVHVDDAGERAKRQIGRPSRGGDFPETGIRDATGDTGSGHAGDPTANTAPDPHSAR